MDGFGVRFTIILIFLRVHITAGNRTTDKYEDHQPIYQINGSTVTSHHHLVKRCWNSVIQGRPTLAKVVIAGSLFIFTALGIGLFYFFRTYCKHKEFLEIMNDLLTGRLCFKSRLEDIEKGFSLKSIPNPASYMKQLIQSKMGRRKKEGVVGEDEAAAEEDEAEEDEEAAAAEEDEEEAAAAEEDEEEAAAAEEDEEEAAAAEEDEEEEPAAEEEEAAAEEESKEGDQEEERKKLIPPIPGGLPKIPPRTKRLTTRDELPDGDSQVLGTDPKKTNVTENGGKKPDPVKTDQKLEDKKPDLVKKDQKPDPVKKDQKLEDKKPDPVKKDQKLEDKKPVPVKKDQKPQDKKPDLVKKDQKPDPVRTDKKLEDKKPVAKTTKNLGKKTVEKPLEKSVKKVKPAAIKTRKETKATKPMKKPKKQKSPKPPKKK